MPSEGYWEALSLCCWPGDEYFEYRDYVVIIPKLSMNKPMTFDTFREQKDQNGKVIKLVEAKVIYVDRRVKEAFSDEQLSSMLDHMIVARSAFIEAKEKDKLLTDEALISIAFDAADAQIPLPPEWGKEIKQLMAGDLDE